MGQRGAPAFEPDLSGIPDAPAPSRGRGAGPGGPAAAPDQLPEPDLSGIADAPVGGLNRAARVGGRALDVGVLQPVQGIYGVGVGLMTQPLNTLSAAMHAILDPVAEHGARATEIRTKGGGSFWDSPADFAEWGSEIVRAIPIVGQVAGAMADPAAAGDTDEALAQALGQVALPATASRLMGRVQAVKGGTAQRVPLTRAERTGGAFPRFITDLTERTVAGAGRFAKFRTEQQVALQREADLLATAIDLGERSGVDTGILVQRALDRGREALRARGQQLYGQLDQQVAHTNVRVPQTTTTPVTSSILDESGKPFVTQQSKTTYTTKRVGGAQPQTDRLRQFAAKELKRLDEESELVPPQELARTRGILQQIIDSPERVTFKAMQDARSDMLKIARSYGDPVPGKAAGVAKQLAGRMDSAMEDAAMSYGGPSLVNDLREANATWEQLKTVYNSRFIKSITGSASKDPKSAERIAAYVRNADVDQIALLRDHLPTKTYDVLRGRIMRDLIGGATEPPPLGTQPGLVGQIQNATGLSTQGVPPVTTTPTMNGAKVRAQLRALGPAKIDLLFGKNASAQLEEIATLADRVAPKAARTLPSLMAGGVNALIFSPLLHPFGAKTSVVGSTATAAGFNAMAHVLTRPQGMTAFRAMLRGMNTNNGRAAMLAGLQLTRQLNELSDLSNPEVAQEAIEQAGGRTEQQFADQAAGQ